MKKRNKKPARPVCYRCGKTIEPGEKATALLSKPPKHIHSKCLFLNRRPYQNMD